MTAPQSLREALFKTWIQPIVVGGFPNACTVWFSIGPQSFCVTRYYCDDADEGEWMRGELEKALATLSAPEAPGTRSGDVPSAYTYVPSFTTDNTSVTISAREQQLEKWASELIDAWDVGLRETSCSNRFENALTQLRALLVGSKP